MAHVNLDRTAQRAARAVYGSIVALAVIVVLDDGGAEADEVIGAVIGSVIAATLAEQYAEYIGRVIRERRHLSGEEAAEAARDAAVGALAALAPLIPFVLVEIGPIELRTAYDIAPWLGLGVIGAYAALANHLAGLSRTQNVVVTLGGLAIGFALIAIKTFTH
jgi:hypothetical protein